MSSEHHSNAGSSHDHASQPLTTPGNDQGVADAATPHPPGGLNLTSSNAPTPNEPDPSGSTYEQDQEDDEPGMILSLDKQIQALFTASGVQQVTRQTYILRYVERLINTYYNRLQVPTQVDDPAYADAYIDILGRTLAAYTTLRETKATSQASTPMGNLSVYVDEALAPLFTDADNTSVSAPSSSIDAQAAITANTHTPAGGPGVTGVEDTQQPGDREALLNSSIVPATVTRRARTWKDRVAYQRMRDGDMTTIGESAIEDQGVLFIGH